MSETKEPRKVRAARAGATPRGERSKPKRITINSGHDARVFSATYASPLKIYVNDDLVYDSCAASSEPATQRSDLAPPSGTELTWQECIDEEGAASSEQVGQPPKGMFSSAEHEASSEPQEWTPELLDSWGIDGTEARKLLCERHNAEIAAEQRRADDSIRENVRLMNELASAKEDKRVVMHAYAVSQDNDRLNQELAAERKIRDQLVEALVEANRYVASRIGEGTTEESNAAFELRQRIDALAQVKENP
jgi:hypothetical protein